MIPAVIQFSDLTVIQGEGNYFLVKEIMESDGPEEWMIETDVTVITESISSNFVLHLWYDSRAVIMNTDRPLSVEIPDDDFRRLQEWSINNGWKLCLDDIMLSDRSNLDFWMRLYQASIIYSEVLKNKEEEEIKRMQEAYNRDEMDNNEEIDYVG